MSRRRWGLVGAGVVIVGSLGLAALTRDAPEQADRRAALDRARTAAGAAPSSAITTRDVHATANAPVSATAQDAAPSLIAPPLAASPAPLPALDAPVAVILDDLERRARAGDARAACRLASELGRCGTLDRRRMMDWSRMLEDSGPRPVRDEMIEAAARASLALETDERACEGVPRERTHAAAVWLQRAAAGGHEPSMAAFARGAWMNADSSFVRHPELVAMYSRDAVSMARATIEAGNPALAMSLGMAYAGRWSGSPLDSLVPYDPALAYALLTASRGAAPAAPTAGRRRIPGDLNARVIEELAATLSPADRQRADAERARLAALFAANTEPRRQNQSPSARWFGSYVTVGAQECES